MQICAQCGTPLPYGTTNCPGCGKFVAYNSPSWGGYNTGNGGAPVSQEAFQDPNYASPAPTYSPSPQSPNSPFQQGQMPYNGSTPPAYSFHVQQEEFSPSFPIYGPSSQPLNPPSQQEDFSPSFPTYGPSSQPLSPPYTGPVSSTYNPLSQQEEFSPSFPTYGPSSQPLNPPSQQGQVPYSGPISQVYGPPSQPLSPPYAGPISQTYGSPSQILSPLDRSFSPSLQPYAGAEAQANIQQQSPQLLLPIQQASFANASAPYYGPPPVQPMQPPSFAAQGQPGSKGNAGNAGRGLSKKMLISVVVLALLLIGSGISLIFYTTVAHPAQLRAQASATAQTIANNNTHATATANTYVTATTRASATALAQAKATANAIEATYVQSTNKVPIFSSTMAFQDQGNWDIYNAVGGGGCAFTGGALHSSITQKQFYVPCFAQATNFNNFVFEVEMTIIKGDEGGLIFRANDMNSKFYYFRVGRDGIYSLNISKDDKHSTPIAFDTSTAIKRGAGETNLVTVIARGSTIYLYINKHFVNSTTDASYNAGKIGVFAGDNRNATDVAFNNARVWQL